MNLSERDNDQHTFHHPFTNDAIYSVIDALDTVYGDDYDIGIADDVAVALEAVITWCDRAIRTVRPDLYGGHMELLEREGYV